MNKSNALLHHVQYFFQTHLSQDRGLSTNTIFAYRDTLGYFLNLSRPLEVNPL